MKIPVFGDLHGNIEGMFNTLQHLQKKNDEIYSFVIQLGDIGYFCDKKKYFDEKSDNFEYGLIEYLNDPQMHERYFDSEKNNLKCKILFGRGNHDDQEALNRLELKFPLSSANADSYGNLIYLPDGREIHIKTGEQDSISVASYGGISKFDRPKSHDSAFFKEASLDELLDVTNLDVLITHQGTDNVLKGSETINMLIELLNPKIHLHGHSHQNSFTKIENTDSYGIAKLPKEKRPYLTHSDFYGMIACNDGELTFIPATPQV